MKAAIIALFFCLSARAWAQPPELLRNARIALRLDSGKVLIVGGSIEKKSGQDLYDRTMEQLPHEPGHSPLQPIEEIFLVSAAYMAQFRIDPATNWRAGDRWVVYTAAGSPLPVVIESISFGYYCGGIGGYATALAHFENPGIANTVAGLRAEAYLAAPVRGLSGVSERPMVPAGPTDASLDEELLNYARRIVGSDDWEATWPGAHEVNHNFLNSGNLKFEGHFYDWRSPGSKPLIFAELFWRDEKNSAVFAANAVLDGTSPKNVLAFDTNPGRLMRFQEVALDLNNWKPQEPGAFLNSWAIGARQFVLMASYGYEGFSVELMELVPGKGLVPAGISFGSGC